MTITLFQVQGTRSDHLLTDERLGAWNVREVGAGNRHEPLRAIVARRIPVSAQRAEQADVEGVIGQLANAGGRVIRPADALSHGSFRAMWPTLTITPGR